jgi:hypothetical protein
MQKWWKRSLCQTRFREIQDGAVASSSRSLIKLSRSKLSQDGGQALPQGSGSVLQPRPQPDAPRQNLRWRGRISQDVRGTLSGVVIQRGDGAGHRWSRGMKRVRLEGTIEAGVSGIVLCRSLVAGTLGRRWLPDEVMPFRVRFRSTIGEDSFDIGMLPIRWGWTVRCARRMAGLAEPRRLGVHPEWICSVRWNWVCHGMATIPLPRAITAIYDWLRRA